MHTVITQLVPVHCTRLLAFKQDIKTAAILCLLARLPLCFTGLQRNPFKRCPATAFKYGIQIGIGIIGNDQPVTGHCSHQVMKLGLDRGKVRKNICMIELEVIQYQGARMVVNKLGTLVEKRSVIFICLDHEKRTASEPCG